LTTTFGWIYTWVHSPRCQQWSYNDLILQVNRVSKISLMRCSLVQVILYRVIWKKGWSGGTHTHLFLIQDQVHVALLSEASIFRHSCNVISGIHHSYGVEQGPRSDVEDKHILSHWAAKSTGFDNWRLFDDFLLLLTHSSLGIEFNTSKCDAGFQVEPSLEPSYENQYRLCVIDNKLCRQPNKFKEHCKNRLSPWLSYSSWEYHA
jgi:hypothetical protein